MLERLLDLGGSARKGRFQNTNTTVTVTSPSQSPTSGSPVGAIHVFNCDTEHLQRAARAVF